MADTDKTPGGDDGRKAGDQGPKEAPKAPAEGEFAGRHGAPTVKNSSGVETQGGSSDQDMA